MEQLGLMLTLCASNFSLRSTIVYERAGSWLMITTCESAEGRLLRSGSCVTCILRFGGGVKDAVTFFSMSLPELAMNTAASSSSGL